MGVVIYCRGCGHGHDNLKSCELASLERERAECLVADAAKKPATSPKLMAALETIMAPGFGETKPVEKTCGVSRKEKAAASDLKARLAATEKRLAEIRQKQRYRTAKWRGKQKVPPPV